MRGTCWGISSGISLRARSRRSWTVAGKGTGKRLVEGRHCSRPSMRS